ncbi:DUF996 domain-containing protein [Thermococcus zilligii]|uniref:DUF996 domain-containing protein n=1 Tax=Thermococcus zilligii TaxID=54076 RepID=UPI00029ABD17|nr:DUF996 domain-containing protein [Thermococcus zilligii]
MAELKDAKIWGGIGAILTLVGLGFIGFILKLVGVKKISEATGNEEIFSKYLWAAVLNILASVILFGSFFAGILTGNFKLSLASIGLGVIVGAILMIVGVLLMKQSYDLIAKETGVGMFHTVALLYIVGAVLTIVLIGGLLLLIAAILEVIAFFSLPDSVPEKASTTSAEEEVAF